MYKTFTSMKNWQDKIQDFTKDAHHQSSSARLHARPAYYDTRQASSSSSLMNSTSASSSMQLHPLQTIYYYSTVGRDMAIKLPRQFDSYY